MSSRGRWGGGKSLHCGGWGGLGDDGGGEWEGGGEWGGVGRGGEAGIGEWQQFFLWNVIETVQ